jgi:hypothetical protein
MPKTKRDIVVDHLRVQNPVAEGAIKEVITPARTSALVEADWAQLMANLKKRLKQDGIRDRRDEILEGKQQVYEAWKYQFEVLVSLSQDQNLELRCYDEGPGRSAGFILALRGPALSERTYGQAA